MAENDINDAQAPVGGPVPAGAEGPQAGVIAQYVRNGVAK